MGSNDMLNVTVYISHLLGDPDYEYFQLPACPSCYRDRISNSYKVAACNANSLLCVINGVDFYYNNKTPINDVLKNNYKQGDIKIFVDIIYNEVSRIIAEVTARKEITDIVTDIKTIPGFEPTYFIHFGASTPKGLTAHFGDGSAMQAACRTYDINNIYALSNSNQIQAIPKPLLWPGDSGYAKMIQMLDSTVSTEMNLLSSLVIFCEGYLYNQLDSVKDMKVGKETKKLLSDLGKLKEPIISKKSANHYDINTAFDNTLQECVKKEYKALTKNDLNEQNPLLKLCKMINANRYLTVTKDLTKIIIGAFEELAQVLKEDPTWQVRTDSRA